MKAQFKDPTIKTIFITVMFWFAFVAACGFISSCNILKKKDRSKTIDKTETKVATKDSSKTLVNVDVKENTQANETVETVVTTKTDFDTLGRIKTIVKEERIKGQKQVKIDKVDKSKINTITVKDSLFTESKDVKIKTDNKETKHRTDPLPFAIVLIVISCGLIWWFRYK
jgi:flagellar motor protein MotB